MSAIVSGGGMGMGRAICLRLAAEGAIVSLFDRDDAAAEETCALIAQENGQAAPIHCDVTDRDQITRAVACHVDAHGGIDIVVNNAGAMHAADDLLENTPNEAITLSFGVNLFGPQALCEAVLPHMIAAGRGAIITCASNAGVAGTARPVYGASKGAAIAMTLAIARRYAARGVRANVILPGAFATPMLDTVRHFPATTAQPRFRPLGRIGEADEIAGTVAYLASGDAWHVNGLILPVDGGATAV